jgi:hypothetical protein
VHAIDLTRRKTCPLNRQAIGQIDDADKTIYPVDLEELSRHHNTDQNSEPRDRKTPPDCGVENGLAREVLHATRRDFEERDSDRATIAFDQ